MINQRIRNRWLSYSFWSPIWFPCFQKYVVSGGFVKIAGNFRWFQMISSMSNWFQMVSGGFKWFQVVLIFIICCWNLRRYPVQIFTCTNLFKINNIIFIADFEQISHIAVFEEVNAGRVSAKGRLLLS